MNIVSYNVRGLSRGVKWSAIRKLVKKHHLDLLCIQETKKNMLTKPCVKLCGETPI